MVIWGIICLFLPAGRAQILGDQTGLSPILSLVGIYVGMRLGGVLGMIVGPLLLLVVINLWKLGTFDPVVCDLKLAIGDISALLASGRQDKPLTIRTAGRPYGAAGGSALSKKVQTFPD